MFAYNVCLRVMFDLWLTTCMPVFPGLFNRPLWNKLGKSYSTKSYMSYTITLSSCVNLRWGPCHCAYPTQVEQNARKAFIEASSFRRQQQQQHNSHATLTMNRASCRSPNTDYILWLQHSEVSQTFSHLAGFVHQKKVIVQYHYN